MRFWWSVAEVALFVLGVVLAVAVACACGLIGGAK